MLLRTTRRRCVRARWPASPTHRRQARAWRRRQSLGTMRRAADPRACRTLDAAIGRAWFTMAHASSRATVRSVLPSFALGAVTGPLWAPCAGPPVLGLVLTTAALQGPSTDDLAARRLRRGTVTGADRSGRTRSTDQLPLPASSRAACSRCGKAARPTENNRGTPSG